MRNTDGRDVWIGRVEFSGLQDAIELVEELLLQRAPVGALHDAQAAPLVGLLDRDRNAVGRSLRDVVVREHSVETWADRVVELAG